MRPTTIDEYIATQPKSLHPRLQELREIIAAALPGAHEGIKWGDPALIDADGMILVIFAALKHHVNLIVTPSALAANADDLTAWKTGKGSLRLPHDQPVPKALVEQLVRYRLNEYRTHSVKWM